MAKVFVEPADLKQSTLDEIQDALLVITNMYSASIALSKDSGEIEKVASITLGYIGEQTGQAYKIDVRAISPIELAQLITSRPNESIVDASKIEDAMYQIKNNQKN